MSRSTFVLAITGVMGLAAVALASGTAPPGQSAIVPSHKAPGATSGAKPWGNAGTGKSLAATAAAESLLDRVNANYLGWSSYDVQGLSHMVMGMNGQSQVVDVPFRLAASKPSHVRSEIMNPVMPFVSISDGSKTWVYLPRNGQYTVKDAVPLSAVGDAGSALAMGTPLQRYLTLRQGLLSARVVGRGPALLGSAAVPCVIVEAQYATPDSTRFALSPNTYWIDAERGVVVRDSLSVRMTQPDGRPLVMTTITSFDRIAGNANLADTTFTFKPPASARLVASFDAPGMSEPKSTMVGKAAEDIALTDLNGRPQRLSALKGKVVLLDFWATWCGPCRRELPVIVKLHQELKAKGLAVVAVNVGETRSTVSAFLKRNAFELPVWLDTQSEASFRYNARSIPTLVVIDRAGKVSAYKVGVHDESALRALLTEAGLD